jgi:diguanylate cyclase (GGDEF)-like protein
MEEHDVRILVADDDATSRLITGLVLRNLGHECHVVTDGARAWASFESYRPDVIISDWMMPGMTGLELCRSIRAHDIGSYAYFVMVTSQGDRESVLEGMNAGADDYLVKPLDPDTLRARLIAAERVTALHRQLIQQQRQLEDLNDELVDVARHDPLTGLANRRALEEDLRLMEARVARYGHTYCVALIDVDCFKAYNDTYGHQGGDEVLAKVANQLSKRSRSGDAIYRYGGDELLCILPEQSLDSGAIAVERMRAAVERLGIPHSGSPTLVVTLSAGLAVLDSAHPRSVAEVLREADECLYRAKQLGRNRIALTLPGEGESRESRRKVTSGRSDERAGSSIGRLEVADRRALRVPRP